MEKTGIVEREAKNIFGSIGKEAEVVTVEVSQNLILPTSIFYNPNAMHVSVNM